MSQYMKYDNIRWVLQKNLISENDFNELQNICTKLNIEFEEVDIIPFSDKLPYFSIDNKINIYYGSTLFINNVYKKYNSLGIFFNKNFTMKNYLSKWKEYMLNYDSVILTFKDFIKNNKIGDNHLYFIRPNEDNKSFVGDVMKFGEIKKFYNNISKYNSEQLNENIEILVGEPFNIEKEWRCFIINGKVIGSSLYRKNFILNKYEKNIPQSLIKYVENRCKEYEPHKIFVMDVGLCGDQYYIIECGCMNSCGFYSVNKLKIINEISKFIEEKCIKGN